MKTIKNKDFTAFATACADNPDGLLYLEVVGMLGPARAIISDLLLPHHRGCSSGIKVGEDSVYCAKDVSYKVRTQKSAKTAHGIPTRVILMHQDMTAIGTDEDFYVWAPENHDIHTPPPGFLARLINRTNLPLQDEWADWLWNKGRTTEVLIPNTDDPMTIYNSWSRTLGIINQEAFGCHMWYVRGRRNLWAQYIRAHFGLYETLHRVGRDYVGKSWSIRPDGGDSSYVLYHHDQIHTYKDQSGQAITPRGSIKSCVRYALLGPIGMFLYPEGVDLISNY